MMPRGGYAHCSMQQSSDQLLTQGLAFAGLEQLHQHFQQCLHLSGCGGQAPSVIPWNPFSFSRGNQLIGTAGQEGSSP